MEESSESNQSFIQITRNNFAIKGLEFGTNFSRIIGGELPREVARDFVHEVTHHWCFTFKVGWALALLKHRARLMLMSDLHNETAQNKMIEHEALLQTARSMLDPLAEGTALFAELDAYPGDQSQPPVFSWLLNLFLRPTFEDINSLAGIDDLTKAQKLDGKIIQFLDEVRSTHLCHLTRETLLSQPLGVTGRGYYLLGYMLLKRISRRLKKNAGHLAEDGLVLEWVLRFFFDDSHLVVLLLTGASTPTMIIERIANRIDTLFSDEALEWFKSFASDHIKFESSKASLEKSMSIAYSLGLDAEEVAESHSLIDAEIEKLLHHKGIEDFDRAAVSWAITMRHMTQIGRVDGVVSVSENDLLKFNSNNIVYIGKASKVESQGIGKGSFYLFFSQMFGISSVVTMNDRVVSVMTNMFVTPELTKAVIEPLYDFTEFDSRLNEINIWYEKNLDIIGQELRSWVKNDVATFVEGIYKRFALGDISIESHDKLISSMNKFGFFGLFEEELSLLKDYVALGLPSYNSISLNRLLDFNSIEKKVGFHLIEDGRAIF